MYSIYNFLPLPNQHVLGLTLNQEYYVYWAYLFYDELKFSAAKQIICDHCEQTFYIDPDEPIYWSFIDE